MTLRRGVVIGLGSQGQKHARTIVRHPGCVLVGAADPNPLAFEQLRPLRTPPTFVRASTTADLLDRTQPDFAVVAVPHDQYPGILRALCQRGIPFLKEKPAALSLAEFAQFMAIPGFSDLCMVAAQRRFGLVDALVRRALKVHAPEAFIYDYRLGLTEVRASWRQELATAGGGSLIDMGYHVLDQLVGWFGLPSSTELATQGSPEVVAFTMLRYGHDFAGWALMTPVSSEPVDEFRVSLADGYVEGSVYAAAWRNCIGGVIRSVHGDTSELQLRRQLDYFLKVAGNRAGFADNLAAHHRTLTAVEACYAANRPHPSPSEGP